MAKLTKAELESMKKAAGGSLLFKKQYEDEYASAAYDQGGFIQGSGTQVMAAPATGQACMAPMEQPGLWMVENTKRKLIYCNAERGHRGSHRFVMVWTKEQPGQPMPVGAGWQTNTWEDPGVYPPYPYKPQIAYPSEAQFITEEQYAKWMEPKTPLVPDLLLKKKELKD